MLQWTFLAIALALATVAVRPKEAAPSPARSAVVAPGLFPLPCADAGPLRPHTRGYCLIRRHYVREAPRAALLRAAATLQARHPGTIVRYMEASWPIGTRPMPPHLSHGDGRQIDLALFYVDLKGLPLVAAPTRSGYGAYEPPLKSGDRRCTGATARAPGIAAPDPAAGRRWRLDEVRTAALVRLLAADPQVRRVFIEPHLKARLGLSDLGKVRFAGCRAARHDDHIHVDFF
ncbi:MAG: hypothetical protein K9G59_08420 [Caulobacter sp.]|nr:hypothetical protein [Caulobacter sp.]